MSFVKAVGLGADIPLNMADPRSGILNLLKSRPHSYGLPVNRGTGGGGFDGLTVINVVVYLVLYCIFIFRLGAVLTE